mgnify:CR=1 FL=1
MLTYTYVSEGTFALMEKPKPVLQHERDAIVKVTLASICSSDLHIKHGSVPRAVPGSHGRARDGGHRRRSGQCGDQCEARRPGDGERRRPSAESAFSAKKAL